MGVAPPALSSRTWLESSGYSIFSRLIIQSRKSLALGHGKSPPPWWTAAACSRALEGMHCQYGQPPPNRSRSMMATLAPRLPASCAAASPAAPAPTIAMS